MRTPVFRTSFSLSVLAVVAACNTTSSAGANTDGATAVLTEFNRVQPQQAQPLTDSSAIPTTGTATYSGYFNVFSGPAGTTFDDANGATFAAFATMTADVDFEAGASFVATPGTFFEQTDLAGGAGIRPATMVPIEGTATYTSDTASSVGTITKANGDVLTFTVPMSAFLAGPNAEVFTGFGRGTGTIPGKPDEVVQVLLAGDR